MISRSARAIAEVVVKIIEPIVVDVSTLPPPRLSSWKPTTGAVSS
ncbi:hypothetical protein [Arthrobacter sp. CG_A4]|nr:hypothetical protein [Arthrobacter sp. CG_A4]